MDKIAQKLHDYRAFPRLTLCFYFYLLWDFQKWFQGTGNPTPEHVAALTVMVGLAATIFGFYTKTTSGTEKK